MDSSEINCISLFSGAAGLDMGVELALGPGSCRVVAYVEREAYACEVLASSDRTLNPRFVEWLMGWPIGWTDCDSQVTEWFLHRPLTLSDNS